MKKENELTQRIRNKRRLNQPSDEALLAVVILGLVAAISDGKPDNIEIQNLRNNLAKLYLKESKEVLAFIEIALKCIKNCDPTRLTSSSCDLLRNELSQSQLLEIFDIISDVLVADGKIHSSEEEYLSYIAQKFELEDVLRSILPQMPPERIAI